MPRIGILAVTLTGALLLPNAVRAEFAVSAYFGDARTLDADVGLFERDGTDLTLNDVPFASRSFEAPPYYGIRIAYWPERQSRWGGAIDFVHAKAIAALDATASVHGTRSGTAVRASEPVGNTFQRLGFSHGHNMLTANLIYRMPESAALDGALPWGAMPYVGAGVGAGVPHVEVVTANSRTDEYQFTGPAVQVFLGSDFRITGRLSIFAEYKFTHVEMDSDLGNGDTLILDLLTHHFVIGTTWRF